MHIVIRPAEAHLTIQIMHALNSRKNTFCCINKAMFEQYLILRPTRPWPFTDIVIIRCENDSIVGWKLATTCGLHCALSCAGHKTEPLVFVVIFLSLEVGTYETLLITKRKTMFSLFLKLSDENKSERRMWYSKIKVMTYFLLDWKPIRALKLKFVTALFFKKSKNIVEMWSLSAHL